jgi:KamA family protein
MEGRVSTDGRFRAFGPRDLGAILQLRSLSESERRAMRVVSAVLPFRVNNYVLDELIDWSRVPDDPIFQLTFPQRDMLEPADFRRIEALILGDAPGEQVRAAAREIQQRLNPHPAGQQELNAPMFEGQRMTGLQHKYRETVLFFPSQGQTCHAYCSYCFRWPQFVGLDELRFASQEATQLTSYLKSHREVTSVLFTGGDPLVMRSKLLRRYIEPLLEPGLEHITSIRIGTKSLAYWPQRFVSDSDADDLARLFEQVVQSGKTLALMAHYSHVQELSTPVSRAALRRVVQTGAVVRCQAPVVAHVNDSAEAWSELWNTEVQLGAVPYYMFVARDTGARRYFEVPLSRALRIYRDAISRVSGLARTARGPSMSATPGKVVIDGVADVAGESLFVLRLLQARNPEWVGRPFFARASEEASWFDDLEPAFGAREFFFETEMRALARERGVKPLQRPDAVRLPLVAASVYERSSLPGLQAARSLPSMSGALE